MINRHAFALRPGSETADDNLHGGNGDNASVPPVGLNPDFNYNDFDVYLFFGDTNGNSDFHLTKLSLDIRVNGSLTQEALGHVIAVTDTSSTTSGMIKYVEFNVTGLGAALALGENADLVVDGDSSSPDSYLNAVSFQSIPEPSTYAMMFGGLAFLGFCIRRRARC